MASYLLIKQLHMLAAGLSVTLFMMRAWWSVRESPQLHRRWVRVLPHVIDTLLLAAGITLMVLLRAWPSEQPWLAAKLIGLVIYIGVGTVAIKRGSTPRVRGAMALVAVVVFTYIVGAAINHDPLSWAALAFR